MTAYSSFTEEPDRKRGHVVRMAVFYSALALICAALVIIAVVNVFQGNDGFFITLVVFGLIGFLTGFQALHYLRDTNAEPVEIEGEVARKWQKGNLFIFFMPSYYIAVKGKLPPKHDFAAGDEEEPKGFVKIFSIKGIEYAMLLENDLVRVRCYPHSLTVERVDRYDTVEKKFIPATSGAIV
ncbi:MAG TPA: hypothetical protein VNN21_06210 [Dehalococcoidia bacterium]|nr:hypothetical protein [Dehalococcoidia bacterium]